MSNQTTEVNTTTTAVQEPEETKPLRLTQKDREVIEYFFTHFQPDGVIIRQPQKEMTAQERLTYQEKGKTALDFAKVVKDAQLGPVKVTLQFTKKKEHSGAKLVKEDSGDYLMEDEETKIYLSKWDRGYDWDIEAATSFDADDIKIPGFKNYIIDRYLSPPTEHESLLSEDTLYSLQKIATVARALKGIIDSLKMDETVKAVCNDEFENVLDELKAFQKRQEDRREFGPILDGMKDDSEPQATV